MARTFPTTDQLTPERKRAWLRAVTQMRDVTSPLYAFIEGFLVAKSLSPKSVRDYKRYLRDFDRYTGCVSLGEALNLENASRWTAELRDRGPAVAHNGAAYLKSFATWIRKSRYMDIPGGGSVLAGLESPKLPRSHRQAFSDDQMDAIWASLDTFPDRWRLRDTAIVKLLFATGMRKNEARQLARTDLHMDGHRSWVHVRAATSKGHKERQIRLDQTILAALEAYIAEARTDYTGPRNKPEPLFTTKGGTMFTEWGWSTCMDRIWKEIQRDTGIHGFSHLLRHTWATNFHRASGATGTSVYDLQRQGGWADLTIAQRYTHERSFDEFLDLPTHISVLRTTRRRTETA